MSDGECTTGLTWGEGSLLNQPVAEHTGQALTKLVSPPRQVVAALLVAVPDRFLADDRLQDLELRRR